MNPWHLRQAAYYLEGGGVVAYPTEAVYGLGCDPYCAEAVLRILSLKQRPMHKGLILVAASYDQLETFIQPISDTVKQKLFATWPGPVTWLLPAHPRVPAYLTGEHTSIAVRISAHATVQALCRKIGYPLVSTSANISSRPPARSALAVRVIFGQNIDYILPGSLGQQKNPSEIRDALSDRIIR